MCHKCWLHYYYIWSWLLSAWNKHAFLLTCSLTPWSRALLEELTSSQLDKKFPIFCGNQRFIATFTSACHLSLSWASLIQSIPPCPTSWRSILISSYHLCLSLPSGLLFVWNKQAANLKSIGMVSSSVQRKRCHPASLHPTPKKENGTLGRTEKCANHVLCKHI
jgi:hypothetical protein